MHLKNKNINLKIYMKMHCLKTENICLSGYNKQDHNIWDSAQLTKPISTQKHIYDEGEKIRETLNVDLSHILHIE